jgi:dipeptide transport system substrate-binding protein
VSHTSYWEGNAPIDYLVFAITPDSGVRYTKLQTGVCDHMAYPNFDDVATMKNDPSIQVLSYPGLNIGYLAFNTSKEPFDNVGVRQALNHATNKSAILNDIYQDAGQVAKNPIPPTMWAYNDAVVDYEYDPDKARQLLADAGYPNGFTTNIWAMPVQRPYNPDAVEIAKMIKADWAAVGVVATIVDSYSWEEYLTRTQNGEHGTMQLGWTGDNGDPDNFLNTLLSCQAAQSGGNRAFWCDAAFDNLLHEALRTTDTAERKSLYEQAQLRFKQEAPWITLAHSVRYEVSRPELTGYQMSAIGGHDFYGVSLDE